MYKNKCHWIDKEREKRERERVCEREREREREINVNECQSNIKLHNFGSFFKGGFSMASNKQKGLPLL